MSKVTDIYLNTILNAIMNGEWCSSLLYLHGKFKTMELETNDNTSVDQQTLSLIMTHVLLLIFANVSNLWQSTIN